MVVCLRSIWKGKGKIGRIPKEKAALCRMVQSGFFYFTRANANDISLYHRDK
jgi:hypothetical protein